MDLDPGCGWLSHEIRMAGDPTGSDSGDHPPQEFPWGAGITMRTMLDTPGTIEMKLITWM
jgi:hypothetical protein